MIEEFDKEIDVLLRQTARGGTASAGQNSDSKFQISDSNHLDADEISAFAENALPEKAKRHYTLHLADCGACRKKLSNLIALNADEQPSEIFHAEEKQTVSALLPWYRKFFAAPNLAYAMGALALVFSGIIVYTVLQNGGGAPNAEVSQTYEKQPGGKGMSSDGDQTAVESYPSSSGAAISNTMPSNAASTGFSSNSAANFSPPPPALSATTANSNAAARRNETDQDLRVLATPAASAKESVDSAKTDDLPLNGRLTQREKEAERQSGDEARKQQPNQTQESFAQNQTNITPDSRNAPRAPSAVMRAENKQRRLEDSSSAAAAAKPASSASFGGKTFKRANNVWYDAAYRGQPTVNVARGTNEYRKLDSGLRGIAENVGGIVVVVWKSKAYRIQ